MSWRERIRRLLGTAPKGTSTDKAAPARPKTSSAADSARAKAIAQARAIHKTASAQVRAEIAGSIADLQRAGPKTLRDPEASARLMGLLQAQRAMSWLMRHDLRRYLVLAGLRQWLGEGAMAKAKPAAPTAPPPVSGKPRVVRR